MRVSKWKSRNRKDNISTGPKRVLTETSPIEILLLMLALKYASLRKLLLHIFIVSHPNADCANTRLRVPADLRLHVLISTHCTTAGATATAVHHPAVGDHDISSEQNLVYETGREVKLRLAKHYISGKRSASQGHIAHSQRGRTVRDNFPPPLSRGLRIHTRADTGVEQKRDVRRV